MGNRIGGFFNLLLLILILIAISAVVRPVEAQIRTEACGQTYAVRAGDNYTRIAQRCGVSVVDLQAANPNVDPYTIYPGQVINIPLPPLFIQPEAATLPIPSTGLQPVLAISPAGGPAGTLINITGTGFAPDQPLDIGAAPLGQQAVESTPISSGSDGSFQASLQLPAQAQLNQTWVINVRHQQTDQVFASGYFFITAPEIPITAADPVTGQTVNLSTNYQPNFPVHVVQRGETLFRISQNYGTTVSAVLQINPQITNPNLIYPGQSILIPVAAPIPPTGPGIPLPPTGNLPIHTVSAGETLFTIAQRYGTTVEAILQVNPQITHSSWLFTGQQILIPAVSPIPTTGAGTYVILPGDSLSSIAARFGTTVQALLQLNPQIINPGILEAGRTLRVQ